MSRRIAYLNEIGVPVYVLRRASAAAARAQREEAAAAHEEQGVTDGHEEVEAAHEELGAAHGELRAAHEGIAAAREGDAAAHERAAAADEKLSEAHEEVAASHEDVAAAHGRAGAAHAEAAAAQSEPAPPHLEIQAPYDEAPAGASLPTDPLTAGDGQALTAAVSVDEAWRVLAAEVAECRQCALCEGRTQTVFGVGRRDASLLVVGEAPGEEEDRQGQPFVGPAGRLLNAMLRAIGLSREQAYIANILKCRPPGNRDPRPEEAAACRKFLDRQIALIRPKAMLAVGRVSAQQLIGSDQPVGKLRGVVHRYGPAGLPLVVTYHPAYLLRTPIAKAKSWQDLCMLLPLLQAEPEGREAEANR